MLVEAVRQELMGGGRECLGLSGASDRELSNRYIFSGAR